MTADRTITAAAVQWDVHRGDVDFNLERAVEMLAEAAEREAKVAVLPEMWASSFMGDEARSVEAEVKAAEARVAECSRELGMLVVGSNYEFDGDAVYNRARIYDSGETLGAYRKMHLFTPQGEDRFFTAGTAALVAETSVGKVGVAICYDLRFPELIRHLYLEGAELLVLPAQWPEPREAHWRILARARAIEDQWFVVAANRCGVERSLVTDNDVTYPGNSIIVDPTGTILAEGNGEPGVFTAELDLREAAIVRRAIPVGKDRQANTYARLKRT